MRLTVPKHLYSWITHQAWAKGAKAVGSWYRFDVLDSSGLIWEPCSRILSKARNNVCSAQLTNHLLQVSVGVLQNQSICSFWDKKSPPKNRRAKCCTSTMEVLNWPIKKELTSITERAIWKWLKVFIFLCLFGLRGELCSLRISPLCGSVHFNFLGLVAQAVKEQAVEEKVLSLRPSADKTWQ